MVRGGGYKGCKSIPIPKDDLSANHSIRFTEKFVSISHVEPC